MNQKWTRAICTVLTSALVFTGPAVEGTTFSGYINSGLEKVYAKTQKQKDAERSIILNSKRHGKVSNCRT